MARWVLVTFLALFTSVCAAQDAESLAVVQKGGDAYLSNGAEAAITSWISGSALEGNTQAISQSNLLRQIETFYGKPESLDIIKQTPVSPRSEVIYFTINYEKGIAYGRFQTYRTKNGTWVATEFKFHTQANEIFPESMYADN